MLAGPGLLAAALAFAAPAAASQRTAHKAPTDVRFIQVVKSSNRRGDSTYINNPATNNKPNALLFVTPNWNPFNTTIGKYLNVPIGVWYNTNNGRWAIFTEDGSTMPLARAFNVLVVPRASRTAFTVKATGLNVNGDSLTIDRAVTNGHSNAILQVTQNYDPGGHGGVFNDHNVGVWFPNPKWAIFQEDQGAMTTGAAFNVLVGTTGTGGVATVLKASHSNTAFNYTVFSSRRTNNNSRAMVFATQNYNPGGVGGTINDAPIGVWYDKARHPHLWSVFNQNHASMPIHAAFNLLIFTAP